MKKILVLLTFLTMAYAQGFADAQRKANINPEKGQVWWGYFTDDGNYGDLGAAKQQHYSCAIRIPADNPVCKGKTIHAVRMWFYNKITSKNLENLRIWISEDLPVKASDATVCCDNVDYRKGGVVDGAFTTPYVMGDKDVYVGYSFTIYDLGSDNDTQVACAYPILTTTGLDDVRDAMYFKYWPANPQNYEWHSNMESDWTLIGNLAMNVLIGDDIYENAAAIHTDRCDIAAKGKTVTIPAKLTNLGSSPVSSVSYTTVVDGQESAETTISLGEFPINSYKDSKTVSISVPASAAVGQGKYRIRVTKVNEVENDVLDGEGSTEADMMTISKRPDKKVLCEQFVKCEDGFAPLVYVSDERLRNNERGYIGVMIHDLDAMAVDGQYMMTKYSLPANWFYANLDRTGIFYAYYGTQYNDPYTRRTKFGIQDDYNAELATLAEAGVKLTAEWADEEKTSINLNTDVTFMFDSPEDGSAKYALGYILTCDELKGEGEGWEQENNVLPTLKASRIFEWDPAVMEYVNGEQTLKGMEYNNVFIDGAGIDNGLEGSVPTQFKDGVAVSHSHTMSIAGNELVQNKNLVSATVFLVNTNTGRVVNSDRVNLGNNPHDAGISEMSNEKGGMRNYYNLAGQKVDSNAKGIVIVNGKKVIK